MINYSKTNKGDILRITGAGAPGYANNGDLVRVREVYNNYVIVEDRKGETARFIDGCGAARLERTEWKNEFPA